MRCSALLLAGGKSMRMGRDKALLEIDGQPLWRRQIETLRGLSPEQLLIAGPARGEWSDCEMVADEIPNAGPLGGVAAALRKCTAPLLVVLAVDLPCLTTAFLHTLLAACVGGIGTVPRIADRFEALAAIYPTSCAALAAGALRRADFSMQHFVQDAFDQRLVSARAIFATEIPFFKNLNTPADL